LSFIEHDSRTTLTSQNGLVNSELVTSDTEIDVTEGRTLEELA
jgi:hypothetical protein